MPTRRFQPLRAKDSQTDQAYNEISQVIDALAPLEQYPLRTDERVNAAAGSFLRLAPRSSGQQVSIPAASSSNFGQSITLFVKGSLGSLRIRASSGTINGATAVTYAAGIVAVIVLVSDGESGWATSVSLASLPAIPAGTIIGNPLTGSDPGTPQALTSDLVGEIVRFDTQQTINLSPGGTFTDVVINEQANVIRFTNGGNTAIVESFVAPTRRGKVVFMSMTTGGGDETIFLPEVTTVASTDNRIETPGDVPYRLADHLWCMMVHVDLGNRSRWVIIGPPTTPYARTEQTISTAAAGAVTTLEPGAAALVFSGTRTTVTSINGGTDLGRLLYIRFSASGPHCIRHNGAGGGTEADIICQNNQNKFFATRGSCLLRAVGANGWTMLYATEDPAIAPSNLAQTLTASTTDQRLTEVTIPANTVYANMTWEFFGAIQVARGATATATNILLRFECPLGTAQLNSGNMVLNTTNGFAGGAIIRGTITFGTPGAACPIYVAGEIIQTVTAAAPAVILPTPSLVATVDTTADFGMAIESDADATTAATSRTAVGGYIRQVF